MIAPFWADVDLSHGKGTVYYHEYTRDTEDKLIDPLHVVNQYVFNMADSYVRSGVGDMGFFATSVVVITWQNVSPFPSHATHNAEVRFRCFYLFLRLFIG